MKKKAKPQAKTGTVWMIREGTYGFYLYQGTKPVFRKGGNGYLQTVDHIRDYVYMENECGQILGLPDVRRGAAPVRIEFTVKPASPKPTAKKKLVKKPAKKGRK